VNAVAVTGLGVVSPHGDDAAVMFAALMRAESAVRPVFPDLAKPAAAALAPFDESRWFTKLQLAGVDRVSQLAVAAADLAMRDAGGMGDVDPERIGVFAGCGMGGAAALEAAYRGGARVPPLTIPAFMPNAPAAHVAMRHGAQGPVLTYSVACASSAVAIAEAANQGLSDHGIVFYQKNSHRSAVRPWRRVRSRESAAFSRRWRANLRLRIVGENGGNHGA